MINSAPNIYPGWYNWRQERVWAIGYDREYRTGSAEIRQIVIKVHPEQLYIIMERELTPWIRPSSLVMRGDNHPLDMLNEIFNQANIAINGNDHLHAPTAKMRFEQIAKFAGRGLGLSGSPVAGDESVDRGND